MKRIAIIVLSFLVAITVSWLLVIYFNSLKKPINFDDNNSVSTINQIEKICEYNNPIVPNGFKKVETESASWELENNVAKGWNNGLVIEDEIGNQFVWIPIKLMDEYILEKDNHFAIPPEEKNVFALLKKYNGFYVARYEAGVPLEIQNTLTNISEETNNIEGIPVSKKGIRPWNFLTKENAVINAEKMYSNEYVYSSLLTDREWVHIDSWLSQSGYDVKDPKEYGNFSNVNFKFTGLYSNDIGKTYVYGEDKNKATINMILATGLTDRNKTNNIYDFYGNVAEGTIYKFEYIDKDGILKKIYTDFNAYGGYYDNSSKGESFNYVWPNSKTGFRVVLYMK